MSNTRSFYAVAVERAVTWIFGHLDEALELFELARLAALSPFHFHRVFKGMVGETPLELHRRLRMERAASRLLGTDGAITRIALDAGYETHESFTRAFRERYGLSPSAFRQESPSTESACARPFQSELAARSSVHFRAEGRQEQFVPITPGGTIMTVTIKQMPELRLGAVRHVGPYAHISGAFQRLAAIAGAAGLFQDRRSERGVSVPLGMGIGVFHDDPESTPPEALRSDAGVVVSNDVTLPDGLAELRLAAGRYACMKHIGPYRELGDAWARFMGEWLPQSGERVGDGTSYEIYWNSPAEVPESELETEMYLQLA